MQQKEPIILYEDTSLLVCVKPAGIASQGASGFQIDMTDLLKLFLKKRTEIEGEPYLGIVHRLDQPVGGIMVYAKEAESAADLSAQASSDKMKKRYYAVLEHKPDLDEGSYINYLFRDGRTNMSYVVEQSRKREREVKRAELTYHILHKITYEERSLWLAEIALKTGRHHQIRVQFSHAGCPLYGDRKYNPSTEGRELALFSHYLEFTHPKTKKVMQFDQKPTDGVFSMFFDK